MIIIIMMMIIMKIMKVHKVKKVKKVWMKTKENNLKAKKKTLKE